MFVAARLCHRPARTVLKRDLMSYLRHPTLASDLFLVGTAHVGKRSREEVKQVISEVRPACVVVELCEPRAKILEGRRTSSWETQMMESVLDQMLERFLKTYLGGARQRAAAPLKKILLSAFGMFKQAGGDFKTAITTAHEVDSELIYGDVLQTATLKKLVNAPLDVPGVLAKLPGHVGTVSNTFQVAMNAFTNTANVEDAVDKFLHSIKRQEIANMVAILDDVLPHHAKALVHDRDAELAKNIQLAALRGTTVAVVGLAHLDGIENHIMKGSGGKPLGLSSSSTSGTTRQIF